MYPKNSILKSLFDHQILKLFEGGIGDHILRKKEVPFEVSELVSVSFQFVMVLFISLGIGILFSLVALTLEKYGFNIFGNFNQWP